MSIEVGKPDADVVVVGGGIIGATYACLLGQAGLKVILLDAEKCQTQVFKTSDARVFAITPASANILKQANVWCRMDESRIGHFRKMHVWDEDGSGEIHFDSAEICASTMGYIISHQTIVDALQERLMDLPSVRCIWSVSSAFIKEQSEAILIGTDDGLQFTAKLLVAADGANSKLRSLARIHYDKILYQQSALACQVETVFGHGEVARQRFLKRGPLAFLPMASAHQSAIVWSSSPEHIHFLQQLDKPAFHKELANAFAQELGDIEESSERVIFPLSRAQAESYVKPRIALIGDSAHTLHPLAGLGANLGLQDAACLAEFVLVAHQRRRDPGCLPVLRRYERSRRGENKSMMYILEGFKHLFENQHQTVKWLRNFGLDAVNDLPFVKHAIMKRVMGLSANVADPLKVHSV